MGSLVRGIKLIMTIGIVSNKLTHNFVPIKQGIAPEF